MGHTDKLLDSRPGVHVLRADPRLRVEETPAESAGRPVAEGEDD